MPKIIKTTVYKFNKLSTQAQERAREWWRAGGLDYDWWDAVYDDFERVCEIIGVHLNTRTVSLLGGSTRQRPCIWFSGFSSQGDGACFEGRYDYHKGAAKKIREYAPQDGTLHGIVDRLQEVQRRNFYGIGAKMSHHGNYYHEYCMSVDVRVERSNYPDAAPVVTDCMRDLARWLYQRLEKEHDYLTYRTSDGAVDKAIIANKYTFTKDGKRFG